jgi:hypothetical protein
MMPPEQKCFLCGSEQHISEYKIYYAYGGMSNIANYSGTGGRGVKITSEYKIAGIDSTPICSSCVFKGKINAIKKLWIIFIIFLLPIIGLIISALKGNYDYLGYSVGMWFVLLLVFRSRFYQPTGFSETGKFLAIQAKKSFYKEKGFNKLFTPMQYNKLSS